MLPPNPDVVTDEEEGGDDNLYENRLLQDVPGNVEVVTRRHTTVVEDNWSNGDDEPLTTFASSTSQNVPKRRRVQTNVEMPVWRKCAPIYFVSRHTSVQISIDESRRNVSDILKGMTHVKVFESLFDDEVLQLIATQSTIYAGQNNRHDKVFTTEELRKFLGILVVTGYHGDCIVLQILKII
ncbi:hypothetical protein HF086_000606 [Spodoptera exigua]|uniref:PiggyBac transposable element-derived protein domain-containing protein n=1 Tax=Spodoptera exigua TaxID=7107 RepID=A0A922MPY5_SPOEX|nr:hypothetical protein HF086_000606 [Spodoptera exigua]